MSVLETPRLIFRGEVTWDPITTNDYARQYNEETARTNFDAKVPGVAAFRRFAIDMVVQQGHISSWNPDGTHRSIFYDTYVTGVDLGHGVQLDDPIIRCPVSFAGMLVDVDP